MIADLVIGLGYQIYALVVGVLPVMPDRPDALDWVMSGVNEMNYWLPVVELRDFLGTVGIVLGLLVIYRIVRFFLPGG